MEQSKDKMTYTEAINTLEGIVRKMQAPDCDIDKLSEYTSEAIRLLKFCKEKLHKTDEEVSRQLEELDAIQ